MNLSLTWGPPQIFLTGPIAVYGPHKKESDASSIITLIQLLQLRTCLQVAAISIKLCCRLHEFCLRVVTKISIRFPNVITIKYYVYPP